MPRCDYQLMERIINLSKSDTWDLASREWYLVGINHLDSTEEPQTCLCGHYPIRELCEIRNKYTGHSVIVGNCCIKKFNESDEMRRAAIALSHNKVNSSLIQVAFDQGIINTWEYNFMMDVWRKRNMSPRQESKFKHIKYNIFKSMSL